MKDPITNNKNSGKSEISELPTLDVCKAKSGDKRIGNQFWKLRSKHGRDKLFSSPEILWAAACKYFEWCENNPLKEQKAFGNGYTTEVSLMRAMTMGQLCFYLHCNGAYIRQFKASLPDGEKDFSTVLNDIEEVVYSQKFQGAAAGLLNANIIARDLGLINKSELTGKDGKDFTIEVNIVE